ncbi:MAG: phosphatidylserine/phosphatidylglycerophosphate/cardiolipin synthase family protein [Sphingorhabdus sp.]
MPIALNMQAKAEFKVDGHLLRPVHTPEERLAALLSLIDEAQSSIQLVIYIYQADRTGREIRDALVAAAKRGVHVQLLIDSFGSSETRASFFTPLIEVGAICSWFSSKWNVGYFVRNHQKIVIADRNKAVIGGFNIGDNYFGRAGEDSWEDFGLLITGSNVLQLADHADELFTCSRDGGIKYLQLRQMIGRWRAGEGPLRWLLGGPTNRISPWAMQLKKDLEKGEQLDMVCAYFTPTQAILRRVSKVARKGQGGAIILPGRTDNGATIGAARSLYTYLIKRGAKLFEYEPRPLHMKLLVIDDAAYIGSANLDVRSLFINMEIMLRIEDAEMAEYLRALIATMREQSQAQTLDLHQARKNWFSRLRWGLAYLLVSGIDFTIGRRIRLRRLTKR